MSSVSSDPIPRVRVGAVIRRGDELLLVRSREERDDDAWSAPGGYLEYGESPEDCAVRWAFEEAGVVAAEMRFLAVTNDVLPDREEHRVTLWMAARNLGSAAFLAPPDAGTELRWFRMDGLPRPIQPEFAHLLFSQGSSFGLTGSVRILRDYTVIHEGRSPQDDG